MQGRHAYRRSTSVLVTTLTLAGCVSDSTDLGEGRLAWSVEVPKGFVRVAYDDGRLFVAYSTEDGVDISARSTQDGNELWTRHLDLDGVGKLETSPRDGTLFVRSFDETEPAFALLHPETGAVLSQGQGAAWDPNGPIIFETARARDVEVRAKGLDNRTLWKASVLPAYMFHLSLTVSPDGVWVAAPTEGRGTPPPQGGVVPTTTGLAILDADTGRRVWNLTFPERDGEEFTIGEPPWADVHVAFDPSADQVIAATEVECRSCEDRFRTPVVFAFGVGDGKLRWSHRAEGLQPGSHEVVGLFADGEAGRYHVLFTAAQSGEASCLTVACGPTAFALSASGKVEWRSEARLESEVAEFATAATLDASGGRLRSFGLGWDKTSGDGDAWARTWNLDDGSVATGRRPLASDHRGPGDPAVGLAVAASHLVQHAAFDGRVVYYAEPGSSSSRLNAWEL